MLAGNTQEFIKWDLTAFSIFTRDTGPKATVTALLMSYNGGQMLMLWWMAWFMMETHKNRLGTYNLIFDSGSRTNRRMRLVFSYLLLCRWNQPTREDSLDDRVLSSLTVGSVWQMLCGFCKQNWRLSSSLKDYLIKPQNCGQKTTTENNLQLSFSQQVTKHMVSPPRKWQSESGRSEPVLVMTIVLRSCLHTNQSVLRHSAWLIQHLFHKHFLSKYKICKTVLGI